MKYFAGIGSRELPKDIEPHLFKIAAAFCKKGLVLRSGAASGSDDVCEKACLSVRGKAEIFIPWGGFSDKEEGKSGGVEYIIPKFNEELEDMAKSFHPNWSALNKGGAKLMMRNCCQVLGEDLNSPVEFVLVYTPGGSSSGGSGQACRIARQYGIPIFDLGGDLEKVLGDLREVYKNL